MFSYLYDEIISYIIYIYIIEKKNVYINVWNTLHESIMHHGMLCQHRQYKVNIDESILKQARHAFYLSWHLKCSGLA